MQDLDWRAIETDLDAHGAARTGPLLSPGECEALIAGYDDDARYRSRVVMARHGYGQGEYRYFNYPLPGLVAELRAGLYPALAGIANRRSETLGRERRFPETHQAYLAACHEAGQTRPTPLILKYGPGDYNRMHGSLWRTGVPTAADHPAVTAGG